MALLALALLPFSVGAQVPGERARDLGIPLEGTPGPLDAITDVPGVAVGHATIIRGGGLLKVGEGTGPYRGHRCVSAWPRQPRAGVCRVVQSERERRDDGHRMDR